MPIPQTTRINPLDLQGNIAIGVSLPFNGPTATQINSYISGSIVSNNPTCFNSTYSTADQIKSNLINLLLTNKGERIMNPEFGADLKTVIFEGITEDTSTLLRNLISLNVSIFVPEVSITNIDIVKYEDTNTISITIQYRLNISGKPDEITVQFI
jgi:phage baseplate assembly protein W